MQISLKDVYKQNTKEKNHKNSTPHFILLEMEREFNVPVARLFRAFKTSDAIKAWWWPNGLDADRVDFNFSKGGVYFISMKGKTPEGHGGMTGQFEEIIENERIVMSDSFADENGRAISAKEAKMSGDWPEKVYITFEFKSGGDGKCKLHLSQEGIPNAMLKDCKQAWSEMFDKLEIHLGDRKH